jgi:hypothetical protein
MKKVLSKFNSLKSSSYVCIKGYKNSKGEVANHTINVNVDIEKAKKADLETLKNFDQSLLQSIAVEVGADMETAKTALNELVVSHERNLTGDNTNQSKGQQEAYISIGNGLRLKATDVGFDLYVTGFANNKTVLVEGLKSSTNSAPKTKVKNHITKNLKMSKFRNFKLENADALSVTGDTIQLY